MEKKHLYKELFLKKEQLADVAMALKAYFIGLDQHIDEIMSLVSAWYLFPQAQLRPTVINLWGMTGSGKTALVKKLVELLDYQKLYVQIDMGEFESDSANWFKNTLTSNMEFLHEQASIICMDEFQFARTLDNNGNELGKDKLRFVWELIDSGKLAYIPSNSLFYLKRAEICLNTLLKAIEAGVVMKEGVITENEEEFMKLFKNFYFQSYGRYGKAMDTSYFLSTDFCEGLYYLYDDVFISEDSIRDEVTISDLNGIIELLVKGLKTRPATKELDLSKSIIFILGNLDEAYNMSHSMNPDISADELYEASLKININNIKKALSKRFRQEQIARLGNNHIIYRAFKNTHFEELIARELNRVSNYVKEQFLVNIQFHVSVNELIYLEGVFPAQGTRPVLTTIKNCIEAFLSKLIILVIEIKKQVQTVLWSYQEDTYRFILKDKKQNILGIKDEKIHLKMDTLRRTNDRNLQAHTAIHEAGHAVLAIFTLRLLPSVIVSKTAAANTDGFCMINFPEELFTRDILKKNIIISLGGFVAEKLIFGEENTCSGVSSDIEQATKLANLAIRSYAMGSDPIRISVLSTDNEDLFFVEEKYNIEAMNLIHDCMLQAEILLEKHKLLLLKIGEYLTDHYKMEEQLLAEFVKTYSDETWIKTEGFRNPRGYFSFEADIKRQLKDLSASKQITG